MHCGSPQVVVAGVTCGDASYSIAPSRIPARRRRESWKVQRLQRQRAAKRPDHINVSVADAPGVPLPSAAAPDTAGLVVMHPHPSNSDANGSSTWLCGSALDAPTLNPLPFPFTLGTHP